MKLYLVRHGETEHNVAQLLQGFDDSLTILGIEQVNKAGLALNDVKFDEIYVSDLLRTKQTVKEISKFHPFTPVYFEPRLREQSVGVLENKPYGTVSKSAKEEGVEKIDYKPEGGESIRDLIARVTEFITWLIANKLDKTILIVSHGGPIINIILTLLKKDDSEYKNYQPDNASITILEVEKDKAEMIKFNDVNHLK
jgi:broad specificity phosphatase PhoE